MLYSILVSLDVLIAAALIALVLLQQGQGASAGAAFGGGGGASGTVFGAKGSSSFMIKATAVLAAAFFINSIVLAYLASNRPAADSIMSTDMQQEQLNDIPAGIPEDVPGVVNIPEGTSSEEMMDVIKSEIEKKATEKTEATTEQAEDVNKMIEENADQPLPSDIPQ